MALVNRLETVSYNGFTFPTECKIKIAGRMRYDQADRTVTCIVYTISVDGIIAETGVAPAVTNEFQALPNIRSRLSVAGQALFVRNTGFGDLSVNSAAAGRRDVLWGPKPRILQWEPLGIRAAHISWVCEVAIPECAGQPQYTGGDPGFPDPSTPTELRTVDYPGGTPGFGPPNELRTVDGPGGDPDIGINRTGGPGGPGRVAGPPTGINPSDLRLTRDGGPALRTSDGDPGNMRRISNRPGQSWAGGVSEGLERSRSLGRDRGSVRAGDAAVAVAGAAADARADAAQAGVGGGIAAGGVDIDNIAEQIAQVRRRLLAYNFTVSHAIDQQGYCTRTVSGYLEVPMTRPNGGGRDMPDSADLYWRGDVVPPVPKGFRRSGEQTSLSEDKRRLNFSVTDIELTNDWYPVGVVDVRASHAMSTTEKSMHRINSTIRASYTLQKGVPKWVAFRAFLQLVTRRIIAQATVARDARGQGFTVSGIQGFIPLSLTADDPDIYGRAAANFSFTYSYMLPRPATRIAGPPVPGAQNRGIREGPYERIRSIPTNSGLWLGGVGAANWEEWKNSINRIMSPRGNEGLIQTKDDDRIIDICYDGRPVAAGDRTRFRIGTVYDHSKGELTIPLSMGMGSYLRYNVRLEISQTRGDVTVKKLDSAVGQGAGILDAATGGLASGWFGGQMAAAAAALLFSVDKALNSEKRQFDIQNRSTGVIGATLRFDIVRLGLQPAIPVLTKVGDVTSDHIHPYAKHPTYPTTFPPANHVFVQLSDHFGVPTYGLLGHQYYLLDKPSTEVCDTPTNFSLDTIDNARQGDNLQQFSL